MSAQVRVVLTPYDMGDVSEADFDAWAAYVAGRIDDLTGLDVEVDQSAYPDGGGPDRVELVRGAAWSSDEQAMRAVETVREALRALWDAFCADAAA